MCGITGYITNKTIPEETIKNMTDFLIHRGPDASGYFSYTGSDYKIEFGHRRLSIIDLEGGDQPVYSENNDIVVIFNGEIYNFIDLRSELIQKGHVFKSKCDTEVIVHLYEERGADFVKQLDGMFAIAIWDKQKELLILARDISGKKPIYYYEDDINFVFASEIKSITGSCFYKKSVNERVLPLFLSLGYVPTPETMYNKIFKLPPASMLIKKSKTHSTIKRYWNWNDNYKTLEKYKNFNFNNEDEVATEIRSLIISAVKKRLISDVPLGAFLSGGIDSSIIVGIITKILKKDLKTFTIGFKNAKVFDETKPAQIYARRFETEHTECHVNLDPYKMFEKLLYHYDEPYGDSSALPTYHVCHNARKKLTVALAGDGGDEQFAGYLRFYAMNKLRNFPPGISYGINLFLKNFPEGQNPYSFFRRVKRIAYYLTQDRISRFISWTAFIPKNDSQLLLKDPLSLETAWNSYRKKLNREFNEYSDNSFLCKLLYLNFITYLPEDLNTKVDTMSMANSLEIRSPFLDKNLTEFCSILPDHYKLRNSTSKYILKKAFSDLLSKSDIDRPKHGFGVPLGNYFSGIMKDYFLEHMKNKNSRIYDYIDYKKTEAFIKLHYNRKRDLGQHFWLMLNLKLWLDNM